MFTGIIEEVGSVLEAAGAPDNDPRRNGIGLGMARGLAAHAFQPLWRITTLLPSHRPNFHDFYG